MGDAGDVIQALKRDNAALVALDEDSLSKFLSALRFNEESGNLAHADLKPLRDCLQPDEVILIMNALGVSTSDLADYSDRGCFGPVCTNVPNDYCNPRECRGE